MTAPGAGPTHARFAAALVLLAAVAACRESPTQPELPPLEVVVASGDGQIGTVGQPLEVRLQAVVRVAETGIPRRDVTLLWEVSVGDASISGNPATVSDSTGSVFATVGLGTVAGEVRVSATVVRQEAASVTFVAHAVDAPSLDALSAASAAPGDTVALTGTDFNPVAEQNVVLFSGVRGRVVEAGPTRLDVEVPSCLPPRTVAVAVRVGSAATDSLSLDVTDGGEEDPLAPGEIVDVADDTGLTCLRLPGGPRYLVTVASTSRVGAARHDFVLTGLVESGGIIAAGPLRRGAPRRGERPGWHERLRALEADAVRERSLARARGPLAGPTRVARGGVPTVGETRSFQVLTPELTFTQVRAVARHVGSRVVLYVDETAPSQGFDAGDLDSFAGRFDDVIHPTVTGLYGGPSDLDGNERIVVLMTPAVNRFTARGTAQQGFVGGFFFGVDLLPEQENSNGGEIFYTLVPDPQGEFSDPRSKDQVLSVVPAILAHEFQHMVSFNERVLVREATGTDALWLSEATAQMAEESVARAYEDLSDAESVDLFRSGNRIRARRYLADPAAVSLIVATGQGTLEERGGGWLHALYLADRFGEGILASLTQTTRVGIDNVEAASGTEWAELTLDWWSALHLDGIGPANGRTEYPGIDLRALIDANPYPLDPTVMGSGDFTVEGTLWSSGADYYILQPPARGSVAVRLGGGFGGTLPAAAGLRLRIVRLP